MAFGLRGTPIQGLGEPWLLQPHSFIQPRGTTAPRTRMQRPPRLFPNLDVSAGGRPVGGRHLCVPGHRHPLPHPRPLARRQELPRPRLCAAPSPALSLSGRGEGTGAVIPPGSLLGQQPRSGGVYPRQVRRRAAWGPRPGFLSAGAAHSPALMVAPRAHRRAQASRRPAMGTKAEGRGGAGRCAAGRPREPAEPSG